MPTRQNLNTVTFKFITDYEIHTELIQFHCIPELWLLKELVAKAAKTLKILYSEGVPAEEFHLHFWKVKAELLEAERDFLESTGADTVILDNLDEEQTLDAVVNSTDYYISPKHSGTPQQKTKRFIVEIFDEVKRIKITVMNHE